MAITGTKELYRGREWSSNYGDVPTYSRVWLVTIDDANQSLNEITNGPGIAFLDPHPEDQNARVMEVRAQQEGGDSPFHYRVTFVYKGVTDADEDPLQRPPQFSFSGSLASAPCFWHYPNANDNSTKRVILNSAGDPIGGLDRDEAEFTVTISSNEPSPFAYAKAQNYVGAINSDTYSGGAPKTWKCMSISANRKIEQKQVQQYLYYEVNAVLAYRGTGWDLQTWDVGFNQLVNGQRRKIMAGSEPVSEPAALSNGVAKAPGQPPDLKTFRIYKMLPFNGTFYAVPDT
jgi:hypothetical protein